MISFDKEISFDNQQLLAEEHKVPEDKRGFIYILKNKYYPDIFKVGRTRNLASRLTDYNSHQPKQLTKCIVVSGMFKDCQFVEGRILKALRKFSEPLHYKKEWFEISLLDKAISYIEEAESILGTLPLSK